MRELLRTKVRAPLPERVVTDRLPPRASRVMCRVQILGQKTPDFDAGLTRSHGVDAVEFVHAWCIGVDAILKVLLLGLQGLNQTFDFTGGDVLVIRVRMNQKRSA